MKQPVIDRKDLINKKDFCRIWRVSPHKLNDLIEAGLLKTERISRVLYVYIDDESVIYNALEYRYADKSRPRSGYVDYHNPLPKGNDFESRMERDWRESQGIK